MRRRDKGLEIFERELTRCGSDANGDELACRGVCLEALGREGVCPRFVAGQFKAEHLVDLSSLALGPEVFCFEEELPGHSVFPLDEGDVREADLHAIFLLRGELLPMPLSDLLEE